LRERNLNSNLIIKRERTHGQLFLAGQPSGPALHNPANLRYLLINPHIIVTVEQDGLLLLIDLKDKNKPNQPVDVRFNMAGDAFIVSDTRGQVTMF
jgi:hypothetical protein